MALSVRTQERIAFAEEMITILRERLKETAGIQSVSADGTSTTFATGGSESIKGQLQYWESELTRLNKNGRIAKTIELDGGL